MAKFKFVLNRQGVSELMNSSEMQDVLSGYASQIQQSAGDGYEMDVKPGKRRASARVKPAAAKAYFKNLRGNTLLKALGSIGK